MALSVVKAGLQTTLQGAPFRGHRHLGMPAAGAADCVSLALANHLVGKEPDDIAIELTLDDAKFLIEDHCSAALTGAASFFRVNDRDFPLHETVTLKPGDSLHIGPARQGCRSYFTVSGMLEADQILGGGSTYLTAALGGFAGRALAIGDIVNWADSNNAQLPAKATPENLKPLITGTFLLRITSGPEFDSLSADTQQSLFGHQRIVSARANRMGMALDGERLETPNAPAMPSAPVFPGTIQCPPEGQPYLLGPDAQTTGGYPRIAQVILADRHLIGQLRPGAKIQFVHLTPQQAIEIYREKLRQLRSWLGAINLW